MKNTLTHTIAIAGIILASGCIPKAPLPAPAPPADTTAPTAAQVIAVATPSNDTTPSYTFSSSEAGSITYGGDCSSATTSAVSGNNTVIFDTLAAGVHSNCTITVTDGAGNASSALAVSAFTVDLSPPTLAQVTAVLYGNDTTPDYSFSSSEAGTIHYSGDCSSATTSAVAGSNAITFATLTYGNHENCTVTVTDAAGNASSALTVSRFAVAIKPYNDTGVTTCGDMAFSYSGYSGSGASNNILDCTTFFVTKTTAGIDPNGDAIPAGQDALYGRDSNPVTNDNSDGSKGFSFTKLGTNGLPLAIQNASWNDSGSEGAGTKWSCVKDNITGLVWEAKTNDGGLRDKDWQYSWYNTDSTNNGGNPGTADGTNNCFNTSRCDTAKYVTDVNAASLCGWNDWRLPKKEVLQTIIDKSKFNPSADTLFIPNFGYPYWTLTTNVTDTAQAWLHYGNDSGEGAGAKSGIGSIILYRGSY